MTQFKFNPNATQRGLKFVRQFHRKRIERFLKGRPHRHGNITLEDTTDLQRSKDMVVALNGMIQ